MHPWYSELLTYLQPHMQQACSQRNDASKRVYPPSTRPCLKTSLVWFPVRRKIAPVLSHTCPKSGALIWLLNSNLFICTEKYWYHQKIFTPTAPTCRGYNGQSSTKITDLLLLIYYYQDSGNCELLTKQYKKLLHFKFLLQLPPAPKSSYHFRKSYYTDMPRWHP